MSWLSDDALSRLREAVSAPDLTGTRYRLLGEIGRGGMSTVFLAEDANLGRRVAIKVLDVPDPSGDLAARLTREARVLARLEHPGIAPVHDVGRLPDGRVFYAMRFVEGTRLDAFAASGASRSDRLRLFARIVDAVAFAHDRGVLHRDLKPENVMVGPFGEVLVMDWGLARALGDPPDPEGAVLGTPGYMAPEQARGEPVDARADVFALGAILERLLAPPGDVPRALRAIVARAKAAVPGDRYASALELGADVARFMDGRRVEAYPEGPLRRAARLYSRHRVAVWLIVAYLVVRGSILFFTRR
jgi:serine/threonine protein kinase